MSETLSDHGSLPLASLRLIVPPLQLVSAALWEIVKQGAVMYYGLLGEFVSTVLDSVPELLTYTERVQLVLGLRARVVLELCRSDEFASPQTIQPHLARINNYITQQRKEDSSSEVKTSVANFFHLVHTIVHDPCQRDAFYQKVFLTVFGPKYDSALQALMRKFLFSLQKLLPVPNLDQTSAWLGLAPSIFNECVEFMNQPEPLNTLIQHHKHHGPAVQQTLSSSGDNCILSCLAYHLQKVDNDRQEDKPPSTCVQEDWISSECKKEEVENEGMNSELAKYIEEKHGQQHVQDLTEDQVASVEVVLPLDDDFVSEDDMDEKWFCHLQTGNRTSSKSFKCDVCGQSFGSLSKLKRHKVTGNRCSIRRVGKKHRQSDFNHSGSQSSFPERRNLHCKTMADIETNDSHRNEKEVSPLPSATELNPSSLDIERSSEDQSLVCHICRKVFTYPKSFYKHQKTCVFRHQRKRQRDPQSSTSLSDNSKPRPVDDSKESLSIISNVVPQVSLSSSEEKTCKRSSRVKTCSVCGDIFTSSNDLTRHMRSHTDPGPHLCSSCGEEFEQYEDYERHRKSQCRASIQHPQAEVRLTQENTLSNTNKSNHENAVAASCTAQRPSNSGDLQATDASLICQKCGQSFTYHKSFEKHQGKCSQRACRQKRQIKMLTNPKHLVIYACNFQPNDNALDSAGTTSASPVASTDHADGCQSKSHVIRCTMCEKAFSRIVDMKRHYSKSHNITDSYPCPACKRTFVRLCELIRHQENKKLYQCTDCKKCFTKLRLLSLHEKAHTSSVTPRVCETCGRNFRSLAHLILHQKKHRNQPPCVCSYCGKRFNTKDCLRAHMVRHTDGYPCPICGKKFYQKTYLKWHQYKHTGQNPYLCETCGKGWPTVAQLKLHMIQHSEEKPFKCEECGLCYKRPAHLVAHRKAKHIGLRPFVCDVCSKAFRLNNELKKHMMVHTGERPFVCPRCGKAFTRKSRLREHREKACV